MDAQNNNNRQQSNNQRTVAQQQATTPQQNYTCSNQQETSWIRPHIQIHVIPVTLFNRDLCNETYALLETGSDNTQIRQKVADALQVQQPKDITLPLASLHGEHSSQNSRCHDRHRSFVQQLSCDQNPCVRNSNGGVSNANNSN